MDDIKVINGKEYEPVIHAKWELREFGEMGLFKLYTCTNCGFMKHYDDEKRCGNCGAHMDA